MTVDASAVTGYRDLATDNDMVRNLLISPYLVNRRLHRVFPCFRDLTGMRFSVTFQKREGPRSVRTAPEAKAVCVQVPTACIPTNGLDVNVSSTVARSRPQNGQETQFGALLRPLHPRPWETKARPTRLLTC